MSVKENRAKWIAALRSGEYGQTKEVLCDGEGNYCCLGVLCQVYENEEGKRLNKYITGEFAVNEETLEDLPQVKRWVGLRDDTGRFEYKNGVPAERLAMLNDECDWNFNQLADLIESEPEGLFYD